MTVMVVEMCFSLKTYLFSIVDHQSRGNKRMIKDNVVGYLVEIW